MLFETTLQTIPIMKLIIKAACLSLILLASACSSPKKVPYVVEAEGIPVELLSQIPANTDPVLQSGDLLNIDVTASDMASVAVFNRGMTVSPDGNVSRMQQRNQGGSVETSTDYYLINTDGDIAMPLIGTIHAAGLTKEQLAEKISSAIYPKYVKEKPLVDVRLMNFRVTILGAVRSPGVIKSDSERLNFFEAIARAGDLDIQGERETILLYRTNPDGTREVHRLDIHDRNFLLSPYFNLQQNDIIYVEPNKSMANRSWQLSPAVTTALTVVGGVASVTSLVLTIINFSK